jgi:hypothetical protein
MPQLRRVILTRYWDDLGRQVVKEFEARDAATIELALFHKELLDGATVNYLFGTSVAHSVTVIQRTCDATLSCFKFERIAI